MPMAGSYHACGALRLGVECCGVHERGMCLFADGVNGRETEQSLHRGDPKERISIRLCLVARQEPDTIAKFGAI